MDNLLNAMHVPIQCDCGHEFEECFAKIKGLTISCPVCNKQMELSNGDITKIIEVIKAHWEASFTPRG